MGERQPDAFGWYDGAVTVPCGRQWALVQQRHQWGYAGDPVPEVRQYDPPYHSWAGFRGGRWDPAETIWRPLPYHPDYDRLTHCMEEAP